MSTAVAVLIVLAVGVGFAAADDQAREGEIPPGTTAAGIDIGGMAPSEAADLLLTLYAVDPGTSVSANVDTSTYTLDVARYVELDVDGMVRDAAALADTSSFRERLGWRYLGERVHADLPLRWRVDEAGIREWLDVVAAQVHIPAVDATRTVGDSGGFIVQEAQAGRYVSIGESLRDLRAGVLDGETDIALTIGTIEPLVRGEDLGKAIVVDLSERHLYLYDGLELVKDYGVAVGTGGHPTPRGDWEITQLRYMPRWSNPGSAWAADMPAYIPPGPSNPLGTRAINLNASGIRIHGTTNNGSIGRAASHGCMRMHRWDVEELYELVEVGMPVVVKR